jgi:hypothetical protein
MQNKVRLASCLLAVLLVALSSTTCRASDPASSAGVDEDDVIALLSLSLGGQDVASVAWSKMSPSEKQTLRDQAQQIALMAQAAEWSGVLASPDVALAVRWGVNTLLAAVWEEKVISETDLSEKTLRSFYEANHQRYLDSGAVRYQQAVYPLTQKDVALRVKSQLKQASLSRLKNCVTLGWTDYGKVDPALAAELRRSPLSTVMGPVETGKGHVLYEVLERRGESPASFEECKNRVKEDLIQISIKEKLPYSDREQVTWGSSDVRLE